MTDALARLRAAVPANVRTVCETLERAGHEAVTVGGAVRDAQFPRPGAAEVVARAVGRPRARALAPRRWSRVPWGDRVHARWRRGGVPLARPLTTGSRM
jgi:hypothetical protein